jgi:hypothetical protein
MTPAVRPARSIAAVASGSMPTGFSQNTCLPAAAAASTISRCSAFGAVTSTTSTSGRVTSSRQSAIASS